MNIENLLTVSTLFEILKDDIAELCEDEGEKPQRKKTSGRRAAPRQRDRCYALREMDLLTDKEFAIMFRLPRSAFYWLLTKIDALIAPQGSLNSGTYHNVKEIPSRTRLAVTLRWLAGGSYLDICFAFGISTNTFYAERGVLWGTIAAIDTVLELGFPLHDPEKLEEISEGFSKYSHGRMKGCVMAMDGWVCRTRCPNKKEVSNQMCFRNRKGMWGLVCFAGCDHQCKFIMFSTKCPGATNDSLAWNLSEMYNTVVQRKLLPDQYYFICDEAVSADEFVLCPFGGRGIGIWRDSFNYHLSAMRQCIERAFGLLTRRWGIFWRPLTVVMRVCAKLHNVCIDFGDVSDNVPTAAEDQAEGDTAEVFMNYYNSEHAGTFPANADNSSQKRLLITAFLRSQGWKRPDHAAINSKVFI